MKRSPVALPTIDAISIPAGPAPAPRRRDPKTGAKILESYQAEAFDLLSAATLRLLLMPTGSGKSLVMKALAVADLERNPRAKAVIAVPQSIIADSFETDEVCVREGAPMLRFEARALIAEKGTVAELVAFLRAKPAEDTCGRIIVCTHATLVRAHQLLTKSPKSKKDPWGGVSLFIDEAHHSRASELDAGDDVPRAKQEKALRNQLGRVVGHFLDKAPGKLLLATATWLRANLLDIVPQARMADFTRFTFSPEQHIARLGCAFSLRFLIGEPVEALRTLYADAAPKTIVYLPHVQHPFVAEHGGKLDALRSLAAAVGKPVSSDSWTTSLRTKGSARREVRTLDFVTEAGRDDRKVKLRGAIRAGGGKNTPDLLWALNLGKEGFDWPELERVIAIGERSSIPDLLQMIGRLLRPHPGKARAEFNIVLPFDKAKELDAEQAGQVRGCIQMVLASMLLEWQFRQGETRGAEAEARLREQLVAGEDPHDQENDVDLGTQAKIMAGVLDRVIAAGGIVKDPDEVIRKAIEGTDAGIAGEQKAALVRRVRRLFSAKTAQMIRQCEDDGLAIDVDGIDMVFGAVRVMGAHLGVPNIAAMRDALGMRKITATEAEVRAFGNGMTTNQYDKIRLPGMPHSVHFPNCYDGKSFQEVMTGKRKGVTATEAEVRAFGEGMTTAQYDKARLPSMPHSTRFPINYDGKSFRETMIGVRAASITATEEETRAFGKGMTVKQYDNVRPPWMPSSTSFPKLYDGKTFKEVMTGERRRKRTTTTATEEEVRAFGKGMTTAQYNKARPPWMPDSSDFVSKYDGKSFQEVMTGKRHDRQATDRPVAVDARSLPAAESHKP